MTLAVENIEAYRTAHRAAPGTPDQNGTVRCIVDGYRLVQNRRGGWRHDVTRLPALPEWPERRR